MWARWPTPPSALHTHELPQRVYDIHQVRLRGHDGVDVLVGHRRFVDHAGVLAAFHAFGRLAVILEREALLGGGPRHCTACAVRAGAERIRIALAVDDERFRAHRAGDDAKLADARTHRAL